MSGRIGEFLVLALIIVLLFGARKLPALSRSVSESVRELRKGFAKDSDDSKKG